MNDTIKSSCPAAGKCSGCQLGNLNYDEQLKLKQKKLNSLMYGICRPERIVPSPKIIRYRNKASAVFFEDKSKNIRWGIYQSVTGAVSACERCLLQPEAADGIFGDIASLLKSFKIKLYDPKSKTGFFRWGCDTTEKQGTDGLFPVSGMGDFLCEQNDRHGVEITPVIVRDSEKIIGADPVIGWCGAVGQIDQTE